MSHPVSIHHDESERCLVVKLGWPARALSWAPHKHGLVETRSVVWCQVKNAELGVDVDPLRLLSSRLHQVKQPDAVAFLTSADISRYRHVQTARDGIVVDCIATLGLSNALRIGDPPVSTGIGTINILCVVNTRLSDAALVEAISLVAEARTLAVLEHRVQSTVTGQLATGTGTDCIAVCCPMAGPSETAYAGKHTLLGHLIGCATLEAVGPQT